jgi:hypothetical protein
MIFLKKIFKKLKKVARGELVNVSASILSGAPSHIYCDHDALTYIWRIMLVIRGILSSIMLLSRPAHYEYKLIKYACREAYKSYCELDGTSTLTLH